MGTALSQAEAYALERQGIEEAAEQRSLAQANADDARANLDLEERVKARVEFRVRKRDGKMLDEPRSDYEVDQEVEETINGWSNMELLSAIALELTEMANGE